MDAWLWYTCTDVCAQSRLHFFGIFSFTACRESSPRPDHEEQLLPGHHTQYIRGVYVTFLISDMYISNRETHSQRITD